MKNKLIFVLFGLFVVGLILFELLRMNIRGIVKTFKLRGSDAAGNGSFGASRDEGKRKHEGLDIAAKENDKVFAPFDLEFIRVAKPYVNDNILTGAKYKFSKGFIKIFYMQPILGKRFYAKGEIIGYVQNIAQKWGNGMKNHIHLEMRNFARKILNPENYV